MKGKGAVMSETRGWLSRLARQFRAGLAQGATGSRPSPPIARNPEPPKVEPARPSGDASPSVLPLGIREDGNGRYVAGGYSFSTLEQALAFDERRANPTPPPLQITPTPVPAVPPFPITPVVEPAPAAPPIALAPATSSGWDATPRWIAGRTALVAGGMRFEADLVYFGSPIRRERHHDQSRIDPRLAVSTDVPTLDPYAYYWNCAYHEMQPDDRGGYLGWLSRGRSDPKVAPSYLFLFFAGLEQRLFVDDARDEAPVIFAELRRLMAFYSEDYQFQHLASRLVELAILYEDDDDAPPTADCARIYSHELSLDVRVRLGRRLRDGKAFTADDCLRWVLGLPDVYLRTAGQRCFDELRTLWRHRFDERYPDGLTIRRPRRPLQLNYRSANGGFSVDIGTKDLLDIGGTTAPLTPLRALLDGCHDALSAYSRLLGREPDARATLKCDLLLPRELQSDSRALGACRDSLERSITDGELLTAEAVGRILGLGIGNPDDKIPGPVMRQMGATLDALDIGFEPDRRYGPNGGVRGASPLILFKAQGGGGIDADRPAYVAARAMVEVAMLAAASDGEVVSAEFDVVARRLRAPANLSAIEVERLLAHARALGADPPKVRAALKRLSESGAGDRAALAASAVEAVLADGQVRADEVKFLENLHTALSLPAASLYAALHRGIADEGPVLVVPGQPDREIALPTEPAAAPTVAIDADRLMRIRDETNRVSALLAGIFTEENEEAEPVGPISRTVMRSSAFVGLDLAHGQLLEHLLAGPLGREDFERIAAELRLMPEGAIETLNEWGFDHHGDAIIDEEGNRLSILPDIIDQLQSVGAAE